jgi:hypothetical protein
MDVFDLLPPYPRLTMPGENADNDNGDDCTVAADEPDAVQESA